MRISDVLVSEGVNDPHIFKAVFMAGAPGSGKTTISQRLFSGTGLKQLNVDKFWQLYNTTGKDVNQHHRYDKLWHIQNNIFRRERFGLLIDGTGRHPDKLSNIKEELESLGYETAMVFVNTTLSTSLSRAKSRATTPGADYQRHVDPAYIKDTWEKTQRGLGHYQSIFGERFYIVDNNRKDVNLEYVNRKLHAWLNRPPHSPIAKKWMQQQKD